MGQYFLVAKGFATYVPRNARKTLNVRLHMTCKQPKIHELKKTWTDVRFEPVPLVSQLSNRQPRHRGTRSSSDFTYIYLFIPHRIQRCLQYLYHESLLTKTSISDGTSRKIQKCIRLTLGIETSRSLHYQRPGSWYPFVS